MIEFQFFWPFALAFGLCIGSFLNVCIYRIPRGISVAKGSSFCPHCSSPLRAPEMVPVLSFLFLGGKCRHCQSPISPQYPAIELLCGGLFLACFYTYGISLHTLVAWIVVSALITASMIDIHTMEIPDSISIVLVAAGILSFFIPQSVWWDRLLGAAVGALPLLLLTLFSKERAMGMGDMQFMAAAGLILGWKLALFALFAGVIFGALTGVILIALKKKSRRDHIPFIPMLSAGILFSMFWGNSILSWYLSLLR